MTIKQPMNNLITTLPKDWQDKLRESNDCWDIVTALRGPDRNFADPTYPGFQCEFSIKQAITGVIRWYALGYHLPENALLSRARLPGDHESVCCFLDQKLVVEIRYPICSPGGAVINSDCEAYAQLRRWFRKTYNSAHYFAHAIHAFQALHLAWDTVNQ